MEPCGICGIKSALKCGTCGKQTYCGKPHQRQHWPKHRLICRAGVGGGVIKSDADQLIQEQHDDLLGRYLVAARDITEETLLFKDTPIVIGPPSGPPALCLGCLRGHVSSSCLKCRAPICDPKCKHPASECEALQKAKLPFDARKHFRCILPLRCLQNIRKPTERWREFLRLEAHLDIRRRLPVWQERDVQIVQVLQNHGLSAPDGSENELVQRICGILDVNSFEVRGPDGGIVRAIFPQAALMAHSCIANVHVAVDDNQIMTARAARRIQKGETLFYCYTSVLHSTAMRQDNLWRGKYFRCKCSRCQDPSELGTHVGSIWCPRCIVGLVTHGPFDQSLTTDIVAEAKRQRQQTFRQFPFEAKQLYKGTSSSPKIEKAQLKKSLGSIWQCSDCKHQFSAAMIQAIERVAMDLVDLAASHSESGRIIDHLEEVLKKLQYTLTPQHAVILHGKQLLGGAYRDQITALLTANRKNISFKLIDKAAEICRELATVLENLERGGINRFVGIALHGLYENLFLRLTSRGSKGSELVKGFTEIQQVLEATLRHLRVEPPESPEGRLAAAAFSELADVRDRLQKEKQSLSNKHPNKKRKKKISSGQ